MQGSFVPAMTTDDESLRGDIESALNQLRTLRDEARVKIHLGSMEARAAWERLEPQLVAAERAAAHASKGALQAIEEAARELSNLIGAL
jgi:hypothetical protein